MVLFGYSRVSTKNQSLTLQNEILNNYGCIKIYSDFGISAANSKRSGLNQALSIIQPKDSLVVTKLDRLGRSLKYLLEVVEELRAKNCNLIALSENIDTSKATGDLIFHIFGTIAEFERSLIRERVQLGIDNAKAKGIKLGRRFKITPERRELLHQLKTEGKSVKDICNLMGISKATLYRHL